MKILLTSFGFTEVFKESSKRQSLFYRMPPVMARTANNAFLPDFATLLLADKIILNEQTFAAMQEQHHWLYSMTSKTMMSLYKEGFIELVGFNQILRENRLLHKKMIDNDLKTWKQWMQPLQKSLKIWTSFRERASLTIMEPLRHNDPAAEELGDILHVAWNQTFALRDTVERVLDPSLELKDPKLQKLLERDRVLLRRILREYLDYVNANIILSNVLDAGFHDWVDYQPFYRQKFLYVGYEDQNVNRQTVEANKLFDVVFPEYAIRDDTELIRALRDKRIVELRNLVQDAVNGKVTFDEKFARSVFKELWGIEKKTARHRNIASYLTIPLDFIPWVGTVAQKAGEEIAGLLIENKLKHNYQWFYLLSDIAETGK